MSGAWTRGVYNYISLPTLDITNWQCLQIDRGVSRIKKKKRRFSPSDEPIASLVVHWSEVLFLILEYRLSTWAHYCIYVIQPEPSAANDTVERDDRPRSDNAANISFPFLCHWRGTNRTNPIQYSIYHWSMERNEWVRDVPARYPLRLCYEIPGVRAPSNTPVELMQVMVDLVSHGKVEKDNNIECFWWSRTNAERAEFTSMGSGG